jgi:hypothetical protein
MAALRPESSQWLLLQCSDDHLGERVEVKRLDEIFKSAFGKSAGGSGQVTKCRHHDHRNIGPLAPPF